MVLLLMLVLGGAGGSACHGQAEACPVRLTLDECVRRALVHHPRLALARSDLAVGESLLAQAQAARYRPQVEINALVGPAPAAKGSPYDPALRSDYSDLGAFTRAEITGLQPIYTFGKLEGKADAARHALEVARGAREQVVNEVRRETQKLYYGLLLARELKDVSDQVLGSLGKARARVSESISSGAGEYTATDQSRLDVFGFEIEARRVAIATSEVSQIGRAHV